MNLFKLVLSNIKKSFKDYSIYFITLVIAVAIFYLFNSIESQTAMLSLNESTRDMVQVLVMVISTLSIFVAIVLGFLIVYANYFIIKRRKKEIGVYLILGMSHFKVSMILVTETLIVGFVSLIIGTMVGVVLSQVLSVFTAKLFEANMSKFTFVFSSQALLQTIIYFTIIFIVVMIFNLISLNRFKLIDLIYASKKNEKVKIKNNGLILLVFVIAIALIGYAYYLLYHDALLSGDQDFYLMLVCGAAGTFLFFVSVSGFLLKVISWSKRIYYHKLNIFVLKQINHKINSHVVSTTIISLMLLLTIGILSTSLSIANAFNQMLSDNSPYDVTVIGYDDKISLLQNDPTYQSIVSEDYSYHEYTIDGLYMSDFIDKNNDSYSNMDYLKQEAIAVVCQSDYNQLMTLAGDKEDTVELADNQYLLVATTPIAIDYYDEFLKNDGTIELGNTTLTCYRDQTVVKAINNGNGNGGFIVLNDEMVNIYGKVDIAGNLAINYQDDKEVCEAKWQDLIERYDNDDQFFARNYSKIELQSEGVGTNAIFTFIGLYLGIVFALASGTVLAIEQLSNVADNKERYLIINQLGADYQMLSRSLLIQIGISFLFPLSVALIHSFVALNEINEYINLMVSMDLTSNIIITTLFLVIAYGGYYLATYLASKRIINEN